MMIFGLGTGRCGTKSLSALLNSQEGLRIDHEFGEPLPWHMDSDRLTEHLNTLIARGNGDIAFYYLPYVQEILVRHPNTKFVILKRERDKVLKSLAAKSDYRNWWIDHDGSQWKKDPIWDASFPKYDVGSKEEAIALYYDDYYRKAERLIEKHPKNIRLFLTRHLNEEEKVLELLNFLKVENPEPMIIAENQLREKPIGKRLTIKLRKFFKTKF